MKIISRGQTFNLDEPANKDVKDKMPDWMDNMLEIKQEKVDLTPLFNTSKCKKCSGCGLPLKPNEVDYCNDCQ